MARWCSDLETFLTVPVKLVEVELGDTDLVVTEHADGMFTFMIDGDVRLLLNAEQMRTVLRGFMTMKKAKGWR